ncbi:uncharacterized protein LOC131054691 [Cryptomeria japonica]|uniref:uncharacterized protein LOC131054691 n=1 Tax=Cryptomeria japonica TaxID=3369 RepID=UPI0027DA32E0|nr:uncharacterized protein LOC131054691 [Cryptomeria japonica]
MDACHVFLGRLWQFDKKVVHNGKENAYTIEKDGVKHTLMPMMEQEVDNSSSSSNKVMLVSGKEFIHEMNNEEVGFDLVLKPRHVFTTLKLGDFPPKVQGILNEYLEIVASNLPSDFPPMRSISHHMDLIPGARLPNKVAYRLTPMKNEEIRKQVEDLLKKGLITESLSPCVVPIVFVRKKGGKWRMCTN